MPVKIGVFSDVHGNVEALDAVLDRLDKEGVDKMYCLGDLVGYGPEPDECVKRVLSIASRTVLGNHDEAAAFSLTAEDFNSMARTAITWTQSVLSTESKKKLAALPPKVHEDGILLVHASPQNPEEWTYIFYLGDAIQAFKAMDEPLCLTGHSHVPMAFVRDKDGNVFTGPSDLLLLESGKTYIVNPGSVGQPRDGDPRSSCGVFDTAEGSFTWLRVPYPVTSVQRKMEARKLPRSLIDRLSLGL
jgi:predicted phosphodiesterase